MYSTAQQEEAKRVTVLPTAWPRSWCCGGICQPGLNQADAILQVAAASQAQAGCVLSNQRLGFQGRARGAARNGWAITTAQPCCCCCCGALGQDQRCR